MEMINHYYRVTIVNLDRGNIEMIRFGVSGACKKKVKRYYVDLI